QGWLWSQQLGLYLGLSANKLRYFTPEGELVPTPAEAAQQAENQVEQERQKYAKLAAKLRELGINPDENL
ncbi:MAG: Uma2 family endonuclease, partial [Microcystis viridis Mv_BB_P_19951000_S69]